MNSAYRGFVPNQDVGQAQSWCIRQGTVAKLEYWKRHAVIRVVKLKVVDAGPKEVWIEFGEPKNGVLEAFLKSFKDGWLLNKCYPDEM